MTLVKNKGVKNVQISLTLILYVLNWVQIFSQYLLFSCIAQFLNPFRVNAPICINAAQYSVAFAVEYWEISG